MVLRLWPLGLFLEVLSTMCGTAGKLLIRMSELMKVTKPVASQTMFYIGLVINTVAGPALDMAAYSFATQSLIAPFGGLDVVWNAALAPFLLREQLTTLRLAACVLIFCSTLLSGMFGTHTDEEYTLASVEEKMVDERVVCYFFGFGVWVAINILGPMRRPKGDLFRGVSLGMTAGSIAGNMFCVKAGVELIERSIWTQDAEIWLHWLPYAVLGGAAFFALSNVVFMTRGLLEFEALFMVTIYEGTMIVSNCVSAGVILHELDGLESWRAGMYTLCILAVCMGMALVCWSELTRLEAAATPADSENPDVIATDDKSPTGVTCATVVPESKHSPPKKKPAPAPAMPLIKLAGCYKCAMGFLCYD
mmetsp:Transcript_22436/g.63005  ORF Transcript_22436/g.63005 Transcript_22436/m.63005 type:complete len:363 (-) Transcript_22436:248-1336(-)